MDAATVLERAAEGAATTPRERAMLARWMLGRAGQRQVLGVTAASAGAVVAQRLRRLPSAWRALAAGPLDVAGLAETVAVPAAELFLCHLPLAQRLALGAAEAEGRTLVAIAGVPGAGKSVFAALLDRVLAALSPPFRVAVVGLDGYHYSNAYLRAHRTAPGAPEAGPLKLYKGAHFTFDVRRLARDLRRLRSGSAVRLPVYDRRVHEPVEGGVAVGSDERLVVVEGNYLLCREAGWEGVPDLFDLTLFLDLPCGASRGPLIARHLRGGRSREDAERHYQRCDIANARLVAETRDAADIVVRLGPDHRILGLCRGARARPRAGRGDS